MNNYDYIINSFTKNEDNVNLEVSNLKVDCITSKNNNFNLDSEGNLTVKSITSKNSNNEIDKTKILNFVYPVGSIYISVNATSPSTLFGGTWEQIQERFLLGVSGNYPVNSTGGEVNHTLNETEIPWHYHSFSGETNTTGSHVHTGNSLETYSPSASNTKDFLRPINNSYSYAGIQIMNAAGDHHHSFSGNTAGVGGSMAHNNMPPYVAVYMWKRTA